MELRVRNKKRLEIKNETFKEIVKFKNKEEYNYTKDPLKKGYITLSKLENVSKQTETPIFFFLMDEDKIKKKLKDVEINRVDKKLKKIILSTRSPEELKMVSKIVESISRKQYFYFNNFETNLDIPEFREDQTDENIVKEVVRVLDIKNISRNKPRNFINDLIDNVEDLGVLVSQGSNKEGVMPIKASKDMDGFCIFDNKKPFIFLNTSIPMGRQIFSLINMFVKLCIGECEYIKSNERDYVSVNGENERDINKITADILIDVDEFKEKIKNKEINKNLIMELHKHFCLTPEMICVYLGTRRYINSEKYEMLYGIVKAEAKQLREEIRKIIEKFHLYKKYPKAYSQYVSLPLAVKAIKGFENGSLTKNQKSFVLFDSPSSGKKYKKNYKEVENYLKKQPTWNKY